MSPAWVNFVTSTPRVRDPYAQEPAAVTGSARRHDAVVTYLRYAYTVVGMYAHIMPQPCALDGIRRCPKRGNVGSRTAVMGWS
jgi:hypothetical protein